ncbi:TQQ cross-linked RaS-RiPP peptide [Streptococcus suis]
MSVIEFKKLSSKLLKVSKIETLSGYGTKRTQQTKGWY